MITQFASRVTSKPAGSAAGFVVEHSAMLLTGTIRPRRGNATETKTA